MKQVEIEYGYCHCRCGGKTRIATKTSRKIGHVKGQPLRFINHHYARTLRRPWPERFWAKVNKDGPLPSEQAVAVWWEIAGQQCWLYASLGKRGYGYVPCGSSPSEGALRRLVSGDGQVGGAVRAS
jgi:hypothetical protein